MDPETMALTMYPATTSSQQLNREQWTQKIRTLAQCTLHPRKNEIRNNGHNTMDPATMNITTKDSPTVDHATIDLATMESANRTCKQRLRNNLIRNNGPGKKKLCNNKLRNNDLRKQWTLQQWNSSVLKKNTIMQWIPSHCIIFGNEKADGLAKKGTGILQTSTAEMPYYTAASMIHRIIYNSHYTTIQERNLDSTWKNKITSISD